jgi:uncharacterized protein YgfB (UPF0149 family)
MLAGVGTPTGYAVRFELRRARWLQYHFAVATQHDYSEIQRTLTASHALADAAEAHGTLAGALCALVPYRLEDWLAEILPEGVEDLNGDPALQTLYEGTVAALAGRQMEFDLLIPAEDRPIEERTQALTAWCSGFLYGLGSGAPDPQRLPGDLGEVVRDLTEITRADIDVSDTAEANESALAELVEFVRVGVQLVFDELEPLRERHGGPRPVLH